MFNTFPTIRVINFTYKANKYKLPILKIVGVTSTKKSYSVGFSFVETEKEDNNSWALEVCWIMLKDRENTVKVIVTDRGITLMNLVAKVSPTPYTLLCRCHIINNVRSRVRPATWTKQIKGEDKKMVKANVIVKGIMDA